MGRTNPEIAVVLYGQPWSWRIPQKFSGTLRILHCSIHAKKINWGQNLINQIRILEII